MKTALSIAGTDPTGGAGIQADLKTMTLHGVYAMSAVTALVAQNTLGVRSILECPPAFLARQLDAVFEDIPPDAVKTGMTPSVPLIETIAEAALLSGRPIRTRADMESAARQIAEVCGCAVLVKGGHGLRDAGDYLYAAGEGRWFAGRRVDNPNTHGTGCTLSSAIAANLAKGVPLPAAIRRAKDYLTGALSAMLNLGHGRGPLLHHFDLRSAFAAESEP